MPLVLVGLGLADERDVTLKGFDAIRAASRVYLEAYTSVLMRTDTAKLEALYGKPVILADREMVESQADEILRDAETLVIAFLVVGDPYGATTHTDLVLRARQLGIAVQTIHNASIMNAVGACGLQLYHYGQTVSVPFFTETWRPDSFYDKIAENQRLGLHTLCLLDIKVKEQSIENLVRRKKIYEPPRYMTVNQCIAQLLEVEGHRGQQVCPGSAIGVGVARLGAEDQMIRAGTLLELAQADFGEPLHSVVLAGRLHPVEADFLKLYAVDRASIDAFMAQQGEGS